MANRTNYSKGQKGGKKGGLLVGMPKMNSTTRIVPTKLIVTTGRSRNGTIMGIEVGKRIVQTLGPTTIGRE